jgi:hypothetical protein
MAKRNAYRVVVREKTKTPLGRLRNRWEDNIKMDVTEMGTGFTKFGTESSGGMI